MKNRNIILATILFALASFALPQGTQAVVPASPDTALAGGNTADGNLALGGLTTGIYNSGFGIFALLSNGAANFNTGVGAGALLVNTADSNTATGAGALLSNTTGPDNTANGAFALFSNTTGSFNTATGFQALENSTGDRNTANGADALLSNTTGAENTADGNNALRNNTSGGPNTAVGAEALSSNTTGADNTAIGWSALFSNTTGTFNTATGFQALENSTGDRNTANGADALLSNTSGIQNTADGNNALRNNVSGSGNVALGAEAASGVTTANNVICIGANVAGNDVDNSCYIGNIFGDTSSGGTAVFVNSNGRLGTTTSSRRFKDSIKPMDQASEALFALKPVTFRYKKEVDPQRIPQFGLVAEEVEKVNRDLVVHDKEGKPYSVRYEQVNAMLLNEFLKEHNTVQELRKELGALTATVKDQAVQIEKVSARLEVSKPATKVVLNNP